ncbi:hypothetical protein RIR_jg13751.t1 [Rhizophagus irregularis DAOM 181602=DAOM 197198]|uniref:Uncharacterized protein n=1 Tax=Rhizophagus irregularis (strain DAOM 181602 / DAOM 197198 / MUCL 43194) TaxID=747089 RepID=U9UMR7_RHIID|nr:hypothetical protein RIR_jg13751.t1 [Rhizophagus irregularis DAOM 181602=DAOM 197198]
MLLYRKCIVLIRVRHTILYDLYYVTYTSYKNIAPDRIRTIHLLLYHYCTDELIRYLLPYMVGAQKLITCN